MANSQEIINASADNDLLERVLVLGIGIGIGIGISEQGVRHHERPDGPVMGY